MIDDEVSEPVALVTGGAGGIGAAVCARLRSDGYHLVVVDVDLAAAQAVADTVDGVAFEADVSDIDHNRAMVAHAEATYGRLDLVVLCAGIRSEQAADARLDLTLYRYATGVNLDGVVFGIDAATPALARTAGAIVVMASLAALGPDQANPVYALTKSAVVGYIRAMAAPLGQRGITINAICPGFTDTAFLGITKRFMRKQGFPLLTADDVADAIATVHEHAGTGEAWSLVVGRPPARYEFPPVPVSLRPDGSEIELRPFLAPR